MDAVSRTGDVGQNISAIKRKHFDAPIVRPQRQQGVVGGKTKAAGFTLHMSYKFAARGPDENGCAALRPVPILVWHWDRSCQERSIRGEGQLRARLELPEKARGGWLRHARGKWRFHPHHKLPA